MAAGYMCIAPITTQLSAHAAADLVCSREKVMSPDSRLSKVEFETSGGSPLIGYKYELNRATFSVEAIQVPVRPKTEPSRRIRVSSPSNRRATKNNSRLNIFDFIPLIPKAGGGSGSKSGNGGSKHHWRNRPNDGEDPVATVLAFLRRYNAARPNPAKARLAFGGFLALTALDVLIRKARQAPVETSVIDIIGEAMMFLGRLASFTTAAFLAYPVVASALSRSLRSSMLARPDFLPLIRYSANAVAVVYASLLGGAFQRAVQRRHEIQSQLEREVTSLDEALKLASNLSRGQDTEVKRAVYSIVDRYIACSVSSDVATPKSGDTARCKAILDGTLPVIMTKAEDARGDHADDVALTGMLASLRSAKEARASISSSPVHTASQWAGLQALGAMTLAGVFAHTSGVVAVDALFFAAVAGSLVVADSLTSSPVVLSRADAYSSMSPLRRMQHELRGALDESSSTPCVGCSVIGVKSAAAVDNTQ